MAEISSMKGRTLFITGASRGIGRAIALKAAAEGANIAVVAKTTEPHPKLSGTIFSVASEIESLGGQALPIPCDIRFEDQVESAFRKTFEKFGGIDIVVNNASAISLTPTERTDMKRYDLMHQVNGRGTFLVSKLAIPYLKKSLNPHIVMLSPPLSMNPTWFAPNLAYAMSKYNMSMCVLGLAEELKIHGIAVNALWPKTIIATAALQAISHDSDSLASRGRTPEIMADAAMILFSQSSREYTGNFTIDEDILRSQDITDFDKYVVTPGVDLAPDFFIEDNYAFKWPKKLNESKVSSSVLINDTLAIPGFQASDLLQSMNAALSSKSESERKHLVSQVKAIYQFEIKNVAGKLQTWTLDLKNTPGQILLGKATTASPADIIMSLQDEDFVKLIKGKLSGQNAFMSGKLKLKGNMMLATKLESLLSTLKPVNAKL